MDKKALKVIADAMLEKKGQDVVSLDLKPIGTAISDYFIVCLQLTNLRHNFEVQYHNQLIHRQFSIS